MHMTICKCKTTKLEELVIWAKMHRVMCLLLFFLVLSQNACCPTASWHPCWPWTPPCQPTLHSKSCRRSLPPSPLPKSCCWWANPSTRPPLPLWSSSICRPTVKKKHKRIQKRSRKNEIWQFSSSDGGKKFGRKRLSRNDSKQHVRDSAGRARKTAELQAHNHRHRKYYFQMWKYDCCGVSTSKMHAAWVIHTVKAGVRVRWF